MRTFEILILATLFVRLVGYSFSSTKRSRWIDLLPNLAVLLIVIHLVVEKYRWQMVPAYGLILLLFALSLPRIKRGSRLTQERPSHLVWGIVGFLSRLLVFILVAALPILLPVFRLPEPTGPYPIGTTNLYLVDRTRPETFTPYPDDQREFMVQVWYPASVEPSARPDAYMEHMPFQLSHLSLVRTHAYLDAPVSDAQPSYPVLIFSHGYISFVEQNLILMEELASHGYIVGSIAHTYHTMATVFPDGRVVPVDSTITNDFMKGILKTSENLPIWTDDTLFLIDELESIQAGERGTMFVGKLDLARLGIFGVSFGGNTAVKVCSIDNRCQAGISLDGSPMKDSPLKKPFMFMVSESNASYMRTVLNTVENTAYKVTINGTTHYNFAELILYSPVLKFTEFFGPIDGRRMVKILNDFTLAFFDKHLKGKMPPLLDGPSPNYPEVTIGMQDP